MSCFNKIIEKIHNKLIQFHLNFILRWISLIFFVIVLLFIFFYVRCNLYFGILPRLITSTWIKGTPSERHSLSSLKFGVDERIGSVRLSRDP